jgi:hypothetical protein
VILKNASPRISLILNLHDLSEYGDDTVSTNKAWHGRKSEGRNAVIHFNVSDPAMNSVLVPHYIIVPYYIMT